MTKVLNLPIYLNTHSTFIIRIYKRSNTLMGLCSFCFTFLRILKITQLTSANIVSRKYNIIKSTLGDQR